MIIGVYAPGYRPPGPEEACEEVLIEGATTREIPCPEDEGDRPLAGQRRWVENGGKLPAIMDGGCSVMTVVYDPKAGMVKSATCNSEA